jgi:hypothetical protein
MDIEQGAEAVEIPEIPETVATEKKTRVRRVTDERVSLLMETIKDDWKNHSKVAVNPHLKRVMSGDKEVYCGSKEACEGYIGGEEFVDPETGEVALAACTSRPGKITDVTRELFGKMSALKAGEVAELMEVDIPTLEACRKALQDRLRKGGAAAMTAAGKDPDAYTVWIRSDATRGHSVDVGQFFADAGISADDLF